MIEATTDSAIIDMITTQDIRGTTAFAEAYRLYCAIRGPGTEHWSNPKELSLHPDSTTGLVTALRYDELDGPAISRICRIDLCSGEMIPLTEGPNTDRLAKYSPSGSSVAFLSDRGRAGDFQLYLIDDSGAEPIAAPRVDGWIEYFHWSPCGTRLLLGVAEHGSDITGGEGAIASARTDAPAASWTPIITGAGTEGGWRSAWIFDRAEGSLTRIPTRGANIWECSWAGDDAIIAVTSSSPREGSWYSARLARIEIADGRLTPLSAPTDQIGWPAASPSGRRIAWVEAVCSDRWVVAGELRLIEDCGAAASFATAEVDVTFLEWRSEDQLLLAGHRGTDIVVGVLDASSGIFQETWAAPLGVGVRYATVAGLGSMGDFGIISESFTQPPAVTLVRGGQPNVCRSFPSAEDVVGEVIGGVEDVRWIAPDGLEIQGWLLLPRGKPPFPTVMEIHGGPVWHWRPRWLARSGEQSLLLLRHGYAIFFPNPRGSSGRGQNFIRAVIGDMGGADAVDCLSGLDHLIATGRADPTRLGVTGGSYGGFLSAWLITHDRRFGAAVVVAPVINQVSQRLLSNIPEFVDRFVGDRFDRPSGKYFATSPLMYARHTTTPTLNICGALDRCTPPEEAIQFHNALVEYGVASVLVTYPEEGHGVRKLPAAIDYAARLVGWFDAHLKAQS